MLTPPPSYKLYTANKPQFLRFICYLKKEYS